ncbi:membrane protein insertase YidC [Niabella drilacis]|uniref:Membrane protein insertase YidC n=1 Tax=Niabella drilacis (strain DSM 25811 / CCM 8410 / CCUG 62505 / LMG 26954 / E90) TaxID=1285928 RepID=A0A1G6I7F3_NIADE|nr:membrane protein insertase YidC [Niabella drilacis]SDC02462.1 YidC/Oxa1 family membrane protein insertase [Niabella drilacis]
MNFDRNTIIGFGLLAVLFFFYFYYNNLQQGEHQKQLARQDSIANALKPKLDSATLRRDSLRADSQRHATSAGMFLSAAQGAEQLVTVENEVFKIVFTNKGGQPKYVELKKFKNALDSQHVRLAATDFNKISYAINTAANQSAQTGDLYFGNGRVESGPDGAQLVTFELKGGDSAASVNYITHQFIIHPNDYKIDFNINLSQPGSLLSQGTMNMVWQYDAAQQESDIEFEKQNTQIGFMENGNFDYHTIGRKDHINFEKSVNWIGIRQRFFNTFLVAKDNFTGGKISWTVPPDASKEVVKSTANMQLKVPAGNTATIPMSIFYGPADYNILKKYDNGFSKLVNLGQGMYAFVRPLNQYVIVPVFDFFKSIVSNFGLVIALLTLVIRLLISPLTYKSYLSGAKMKALRPEIATLKEKFGADQQAMSMEQMKLFREAGVNPLGGCIPALFQIPIFFALYSFFNASVDLRGADFLWASDLSAFDDPIKFGIHIPLLGSHLSLFTITATITSLLISIYSMSMSPDQSNPMMKYMPYIFPVFLLFIFNRLPSALTWYYTVSNLITLALQFVIQTYIIDHDKILARIQENRKKPKTKSKWQERLEQMQEQQKQMQDQRKKK